MKVSGLFAGCCCLLLVSGTAAAENWLQFHSESWSIYSQKLHKKLNFKNLYYYDSDSVRRNGLKEVSVWIKEVSDNDRFYVGKGNPERETSFRHLKLWCDKGKFNIVGEEGDVELHESMSDEIRPGTQYAYLSEKLCSK